jgi:hypothetical protein
MSATTPICPAAPARTRSECERRWGSTPASMSDRFLEQRQRKIANLRSSGDLAGAERFGWLSLAALWANVATTRALAIDPRHDLDVGASMLASLKNPGGAERVRDVVVNGTDLAAADPRDAYALKFADLAASAATRAVVDVDGSPLPAQIVIAAIAALVGNA